MQIVSIRGTRHNCEAAKHKIEELVKVSREREAHSQSKVSEQM